MIARVRSESRQRDKVTTMADDINQLVKWAIDKAKKLDPNKPDQDRLRVSVCDRAADVLLAKPSRRGKKIKRLLDHAW